MPAGIRERRPRERRRIVFIGGEALGVRLRTGGAARSCRLYRTNKNGDHSKGGSFAAALQGALRALILQKLP
jgi:hypothetical protein